MRNTMLKPIAALCLSAALALPIAAQADDLADRTAVAKQIVERTLLKTLDTGFAGALEKTVAQMPAEKAEKVRAEAKTEFDTQRATLLDGLSKHYAEKFSMDELKHLAGIYEDKVYQRFQALNADPKSEINMISQAAVTRLLNMLTLAAASEQKPGQMPGNTPMQMPK